jgi:hypothetical protein
VHFFPLTKQLSLPPNFTFHSTNTTTINRPKSKFIILYFVNNSYFLDLARTVEVIKGSSLSSVVGSTSRFITLQIEKPSPSDDNNLNLPSNLRTSTDVLYRPKTSVSHHRSNTVPSRYRKQTDSIKTSNQQTTHLSPMYKRKENPQQPFSPSLLQPQPRRRIRLIDDTDDNDSPTSSIVNRDD